MQGKIFHVRSTSSNLESKTLDSSVLLARPHDSGLNWWHAVERVLALVAMRKWGRFSTIAFQPGHMLIQRVSRKSWLRSSELSVSSLETWRCNDDISLYLVSDLWRYTAGDLSKSGGENALMESIQRYVSDCRDLLILIELLHCFTLRLLWYNAPPIRTNLPSFSNLVEFWCRPDEVCFVGSILFPFQIEVWEKE